MRQPHLADYFGAVVGRVATRMAVQAHSLVLLGISMAVKTMSFIWRRSSFQTVLMISKLNMPVKSAAVKSFETSRRFCSCFISFCSCAE